MTEPQPLSAPPSVTVRRWRPDEPVGDITKLLHRAYRPQVEMGLRPLAGRQDDETTRARFSTGEAFLAVATEEGRERMLGCILLEEHETAEFPDWFLRPDVGHYSLFAVDPDAQGLGVGMKLLQAIDDRSRELGFKHLALSMAEPDTKLMQFYLNRGYTLVQHWQWPYTNYRSVILSRPLDAPGAPARAAGR